MTNHRALLVSLLLGCSTERTAAPPAAPPATRPTVSSGADASPLSPAMSPAATPVAPTGSAAPTGAPAGGWIIMSGSATAAQARTPLDLSPNAALVRVVRAQEECSGLGGMHLRMEVIRLLRGASVRVLSAGGHGVSLPIEMQVVGSTWEVAFTPGAGRSAPRGWCVDDLGAAQGVVDAIAPPR